MHKDRNNRSWSELKIKKNYDEPDGKTLRADKEDFLDSIHDSRKEKNERATRQLEGVKNIFKSMADYDEKQNKSSKKIL